MKRLAGVFVVAAIMHFSLKAQDPVTVLNNYHQNLPAEHIYLHLDKQAYVPGETIWFKAYLYTPGVANRLSTNLYVELLNEKEEMIQSLKLPVQDGKIAINQFEVPANAVQGIYMIRAWTNYTRFADASYVFKKTIAVYTGTAPSPTDNKKTGYTFEWFPESGKLISGVDNTIAFRCMDAQLNPAVVSGTLLNEKGDDLGSFSTNQYGLGYFNYTPAQGVKYFAELQFPDRSKQKIELPPSDSEGIALSVADNDNGKDFTLLASPTSANLPGELLLLAVMDNEIILNQKLQIKDNQAEGSISADNLRDGVIQFLVFDKNNNLLARRTSFVINKKRQIPVELKTERLDLSPKALNTWSFAFPTGIAGNFSVAITDVQKEMIHADDDNILSSLLLQSGNMQPLRFSTINDDEMRDLVLLTGGDRYNSNWTEFIKRRRPKPGEELHLPLQGTIYESSNNKLLTSGELNFFVKTKDSVGRQYSVPVMEDGGFKLYGLVFDDTARVYYRWKGSKGEKAIPTSIQLERERTDYSSLLKSNFPPSYIALKKQLLEKTNAASMAVQIMADVQAEKAYLSRLKTQQQPNVAEKKAPAKEQDVNKRYTTGAFTSNANAKVVNLINEPPNNLSGNIFDYLTGRLSGVSIEKTAALTYALYTGRSNTTGEVIRNVRTATVTNPRSGTSRTPQDFTELGRVNGKFYLDEVEVTSDVIARIQVDQIALVKYFPPGSIMLPGIGLSGVLAVYTKKPEDMGKEDKRYFNSIEFPGYPAARKFYSPDYIADDKKMTDARRTIYWNPDIILSEGNEIRINFHNSDKAKKLRVVLEGITTDGRLVSFEKIVE